MAHFIHDTCIGCDACRKACPVDCISGESKQLYVIDPTWCIDCGVCGVYCPVSCITDETGEFIERIPPREIPKAGVHVEDCTGCTFCVDACPFDCIEMIEHEDSFSPVAKVTKLKECVGCRLCEEVCIKDCIAILPPAGREAYERGELVVG